MTLKLRSGAARATHQASPARDATVQAQPYGTRNYRRLRLDDERGYLRLHASLLVRLAHVLQTTPDTILAAKEVQEGHAQALDRRFVRRLQKIDQLSDHQKKILLGTIDAFLTKVS